MGSKYRLMAYVSSVVIRNISVNAVLRKRIERELVDDHGRFVTLSIFKLQSEVHVLSLKPTDFPSPMTVIKKQSQSS